MVDVASIVSFAGGVKSAADITKAMMNLTVKGEVQEKIIELQSVILGIQSDALTGQQQLIEMSEHIKDLEAEISQFKSFGAERDLYALEDVDRGAFAYVHKNQEGAPWLCVPCFDNAYKSVLQNIGLGEGSQRNFECPKCKMRMSVHHRKTPGGQSMQSRSPRVIR